MLELSRLLKVTAFLLAMAGTPCIGLISQGETDPLLRYRSNAETHGLYEIREDVRAFIRKENERNKTEWVAGDPDIRMYAPRCAVPLRIHWRRDERRRSVEVVCTRTVKGAPEKNWQLPVPIRRRPNR